MRGDVIIVEEHHRRVAARIVAALQEPVRSAGRTYAVTVAGESGSGKSETGKALQEAFERAGFNAAVLQQDDYFVVPPKTNDTRRRENISRVGTNEVRLELLNDHLAAAKNGEPSIVKPLVVYEDDYLTEETLPLAGLDVVIAEGTYTTLLEAADTHIFIARDYHQTLSARKRRAREKFDPFIEEVLEVEHAIIAPHRARAEIVITNEYEVEL
ncbi:MAG: hypothetical protein PF508_07210 [Spirochaeta sp.]|jgi:uridine kinase|nr:hypothetical protein [Spirochaeta sp.]